MSRFAFLSFDFFSLGPLRCVMDFDFHDALDANTVAALVLFNKHKAYEARAIVMIVAFACGVPMMLWSLLYRHRHNLLHVDAQYLGFLVNDYRSEFWFWEVVECCRKLALTGVALFFGEQGSLLQLAVATALVAMYMVVLVKLQPYALPSDNDLAQLVSAGLAIALFASMLLKVKTSFASTGRFELGYSEESLGYMLVTVTVVVIVAWSSALVLDVRSFNMLQSFRFESNGHLLMMPVLDGVQKSYHAFISHSQQDGGDQPHRILSVRVLQWCVKEFQDASMHGKHIVLVLDSDPRHGGMSVDEFVEYSTSQRERCKADMLSKASNLWNQAVFDGDVACTELCEWVSDHVTVQRSGGSDGDGAHLVVRAFRYAGGGIKPEIDVPQRSYPVIPWYRYAVEKRVALQLVAESILAAPQWCLPVEKRHLKLPALAGIRGRRRYDVCMSAFCTGSNVIKAKLEAFAGNGEGRGRGVRVHLPQRGQQLNRKQLALCDAMLVLITKRRGRVAAAGGGAAAAASPAAQLAALAAFTQSELLDDSGYQLDVRAALDAGLRIVLVHECGLHFGEIQSALWELAGSVVVFRFY
eukprot:g5255.t1